MGLSVVVIFFYVCSGFSVQNTKNLLFDQEVSENYFRSNLLKIEIGLKTMLDKFLVLFHRLCIFS